MNKQENKMMSHDNIGVAIDDIQFENVTISI